jgi:hypothetical protein
MYDDRHPFRQVRFCAMRNLEVIQIEAVISTEELRPASKNGAQLEVDAIDTGSDDEDDPDVIEIRIDYLEEDFAGGREDRPPSNPGRDSPSSPAK